MMRPFGLCRDGALPRLGGSKTRPHASTSVQYFVQATTRSSFPIAARITVAGLQAYNSLRAVIRGHKFILQALNAERQPPLRSAQGGLSAVHISPNPRCDDTVTIFRCILP